MTARMFLTSEAPRFVHHHLLKLIVLSYLLAALYPAPGLRIKEAAIVDIQTASGRATATTPSGSGTTSHPGSGTSSATATATATPTTSGPGKGHGPPSGPPSPHSSDPTADPGHGKVG